MKRSRSRGSRRLTTALGLSASLALAATLAGSGFAKEKPGRKMDQIWVHPDYSRMSVESIAMLPAFAFNGNLQNEKLVEISLAQALRLTGYRWVSPTVTKELLRASFGGDSALNSLRATVTRTNRVDSLVAPRLCQKLRAKAILSTWIERFEKMEIEWNQAGKPSTTVQIRAALVDSAGRLLWTGSGSETVDGTYHDPSAGTLGVKGSGLEEKPLTGQAGAPGYEEVLGKLLARWAKEFPTKPTPALADTTRKS